MAIEMGSVENLDGKWVRASSYGTAWHKVNCSGNPICGRGVPRNPEYASEPSTSRQSTSAYICVKCYRIERGLDQPLCGSRCAVDVKLLAVEVARLLRKGKRLSNG